MAGGRPSKYKPEFAEQAHKLCLLGATDPELANFFKVAISTIALWKVQHAEFSDALKISKTEADDLVAKSLYRRALGYEVDDVDLKVVKGKLTKTATRKHIPPDVTACIFWLKNRRPEEWRDVQHRTLAGPNDGPIPMTHTLDATKLSTQALQELMAARDATKPE